jgi:hypothetical protein
VEVRGVVLADSNCVLADSNCVLADSNCVLADSNFVLADSNCVLVDSNFVLADSDCIGSLKLLGGYSEGIQVGEYGSYVFLDVTPCGFVGK